MPVVVGGHSSDDRMPAPSVGHPWPATGAQSRERRVSSSIQPEPRNPELAQSHRPESEFVHPTGLPRSKSIRSADKSPTSCRYGRVHQSPPTPDRRVSSRRVNRSTRHRLAEPPPSGLRPCCRPGMTNSHTHTHTHTHTSAATKSQEIERLLARRPSSHADRAAERFAGRDIANRRSPATDVRLRRSRATDRAPDGDERPRLPHRRRHRRRPWQALQDRTGPARRPPQLRPRLSRGPRSRRRDVFGGDA
jgi:hypothetical protein